MPQCISERPRVSEIERQSAVPRRLSARAFGRPLELTERNDKNNPTAPVDNLEFAIGVEGVSPFLFAENPLNNVAAFAEDKPQIR